jgi:hypothetical protein
MSYTFGAPPDSATVPTQAHQIYNEGRNPSLKAHLALSRSSSSLFSHAGTPLSLLSTVPQPRLRPSLLSTSEHEAWWGVRGAG